MAKTQYVSYTSGIYDCLNITHQPTIFGSTTGTGNSLQLYLLVPSLPRLQWLSPLVKKTEFGESQSFTMIFIFSHWFQSL